MRGPANSLRSAWCAGGRGDGVLLSNFLPSHVLLILPPVHALLRVRCTHASLGDACVCLCVGDVGGNGRWVGVGNMCVGKDDM